MKETLEEHDKHCEVCQALGYGSVSKKSKDMDTGLTRVGNKTVDKNDCVGAIPTASIKITCSDEARPALEEIIGKDLADKIPREPNRKDEIIDELIQIDFELNDINDNPRTQKTQKEAKEQIKKRLDEYAELDRKECVEKLKKKQESLIHYFPEEPNEKDWLILKHGLRDAIDEVLLSHGAVKEE